MSKLTFSTSRPLDWKILPRKLDVHQGRIVADRNDGLNRTRPLNHLRGNAIHRAADTARGGVEEHIANRRTGRR